MNKEIIQQWYNEWLSKNCDNDLQFNTVQLLTDFYAQFTAPSDNYFDLSYEDVMITIQEMDWGFMDNYIDAKELMGKLLVLKNSKPKIAQFSVSDKPNDEKGCPCLYLKEPCHPMCTCVNGESSIGCAYCCKYGSIEQRTKRAEILANKFVSDKQGEESKTVWYISEDNSIATPYTHIVNHVKDGTFFSGSKEQCDEVIGIIEYIRAAAVSAPVEDKQININQ